ncbi:hypothetical protein, partial [Stutzerimonas nitrititolerans]|uniref:hypothetical protein n=1 Tax=Stutzerimonas nitrititolerans TaxID=2482751 RepID=UPI00289CB0C8
RRATSIVCHEHRSDDLCCCAEDGSRPSEVGLQERTSNHPVLLHPKGVVVSDRGKVIPEDGR